MGWTLVALNQHRRQIHQKRSNTKEKRWSLGWWINWFTKERKRSWISRTRSWSRNNTSIENLNRNSPSQNRRRSWRRIQKTSKIARLHQITTRKRRERGWERKEKIAWRFISGGGSDQIPWQKREKRVFTSRESYWSDEAIVLRAW